MMRLSDAFLTRPVAHRALHDRAAGRPENSRAAIRAAIDAGYAIEIDLQLSSDGVPMVFHDYTLDRLTAETGPIHARSAADLQAIGLTDAEDGIPTFAEVLTIVAGQVPLLVELKDQDGPEGAGGGPLEQAAAEALKGYAGDVAVMSFNPRTMARFHAAAPDVPTGLTTCSFSPEHFADLPEDLRARLAGITEYEAVGASFISHQWRELSMPRVAELKAGGAAILCWTIRSAREEAEARRYADNVTFEHYLA